MEKKNSVFGVIGIKAEMANWNADFNGDPKNTPDGTIFGSDKSLKYAIKQQWLENGEKVLMVKTKKIEKGNLLVNNLEERYTKLFGKIDTKNNIEVLENLFKAIDTLTFGVAFAVKKTNHSITGAVQINQGFNKYEDTNIITQDILSPFANSNAEGNVQATIGKMIHVDEAHYCYSFSVNPTVYAEYKTKTLFGENFEGYTEEAYEKFKEAALTAVTGLNSATKSGCMNEYAIFINLKEGSKKMLPKFDTFVTVEKEDKVIVNINKAKNLLEAYKNEIENIEIYYDDELTEVDYSALTEEIKELIIEKILY